ncbi:MAG TPA: tetratricopeptide repeat protein [Candidatus Latescibacteria bacterium]|nr:tetratricopeptide repeat protein [Candidatus Latescibacterota bacterium]
MKGRQKANLILLVGLLYSVLGLTGLSGEARIPYLLNWRRLIGESLYSPIAAEDSLIYVGSGDGYVYCLRAADGTAIWRFRTGGPILSISLTDDMVVAGSDDRWLYAIDRTSGKLRWRFIVGDRISGSIIDSVQVFFTTGEGYLYAVDLRTGDLLWQYRVPAGIRSAPAVDTDRVYFGSDDSGLRAVSKEDGSLMWAFQTRGPVRTDPLVVGELVYFGDNDGWFYALNNNGILAWKRMIGGRIGTATARGNRIFFGSSNGLVYAMNEDGELVWKRKVAAEVSKTPLAWGNTLFIADEGGSLHALGADTGEERWSLKTSGRITGRIMISQNALLFMASDGFLYSFELDPVIPSGQDDYLWDYWVEQLYRGRKTGYFHVIAEQIQGGGIHLKMEEVNWEIGFRRRLSERLVDSKYRPISFEDKRIEGEQTISVRGDVRGETLVIQKRLGGGAIEEVVPIGEEVISPEFVERFIFEDKQVPPGTTFSIPVFDYDTLRECNLTLTVIDRDTLELERESVPVFMAEKTCDLDELKGIVAREWITADGTVLAAEMPDFAISSRVVPIEKALAWKGFEDENVIPSDVTIDSPLDVDSLDVSLTVSRGDLKRILAVEDRQHVRLTSDGTAHVSVNRITMGVGEASELPFNAKDLLPYLEPTIFVQSRDPRIVATARKIVADETNSLQATRRILNWVYSNMRPKETNVRFKSALEVFEDMEGTCTEYTLLFIALVRAAGIPARASVGLLASGQGSFGPHMWAQVYLGRWIDVDPSYNQMGVDATHIKFADGSLRYEDMLGLNVPLSIALAHMDTIRVVGYRMDKVKELTEANRMFRKASDLIATFQDEKALKILMRILELPVNSETDDAIYQIGEILLNQHNTKDARKYLEQVLKRFPDSDRADDALFKLAKIWEEKGKVREAWANYQRLVEEYPSSEFADDSLYRVGEIYEKDFGDLKAALRAYEQVVERYPGSGWALLAQEAQKRCREALAKGTDNPDK